MKKHFGAIASFKMFFYGVIYIISFTNMAATDYT